MNKYQKIAIIVGIVALLIVYGKTITKIGFSAMTLMGKGLIIVVATLLVISFLKKAGKKK
ncbi:MAG: hypothetical protein Q8P40_08180 [Nitrospirota bacterium]|nr:hypothetical protein [Nitrospirota bacterium]